jgi:hypothetical protein
MWWARCNHDELPLFRSWLELRQSSIGDDSSSRSVYAHSDRIELDVSGGYLEVRWYRYGILRCSCLKLEDGNLGTSLTSEQQRSEGETSRGASVAGHIRCQISTLLPFQQTFRTRHRHIEEFALQSSKLVSKITTSCDTGKPKNLVDLL